MRHRIELYLDIEFSTIFDDILTNELSSIVCVDDAGNAIPRYDVTPYELTYLLICDETECFCFHIFGEIIDGHNSEFSLSLS